MLRGWIRRLLGSVLLAAAPSVAEETAGGGPPKASVPPRDRAKAPIPPVASIEKWETAIRKAHRVEQAQPIYRTPDGDVEGKVHGQRAAQEVVARPGYALGGLVVKTGNRLDGFRAIFMRVRGGRLDPGDAYESEWVGGRGGSPETKLGATGKPVLGIHGASGLEVDRLGLVLWP